MLLSFLAALCAIWGIRNLVSVPTKEATDTLPLFFRLFAPGIFFFSEEAGGFLEMTMTRHSARVQEEIHRSALPLDVRDVYGASLFFALLGGGVAALAVMGIQASLLVKMMTVAVIGVAGLMYPEAYLQKRAEERMDEILRNLPFAIDLIASSMSAGLDFGAAVRYLVSTGKEDILKREFSIFLRDVELGKTRTEALKDMQTRIGAKEFSRFVSAISYGMDSGSSVIDIMRIQVEEMRRVKFARAEQAAAKAPVKMLVPMAVFIFPAMFAIILVPVLLRVKDAGILGMIGK